MATSGSFVLHVGQAFAFMGMMVAWLFIYAVLLMAPFYVFCKVTSILAWLARRIRRSPEWRG
jgi:hypothetical protein